MLYANDAPISISTIIEAVRYTKRQHDDAIARARDVRRDQRVPSEIGERTQTEEEMMENRLINKYVHFRQLSRRCLSA